MDLCAYIVEYNDCRWNCGSFQHFMMIVGGIAYVFTSLYRLPVELCVSSLVHSERSVEPCSCSVVNSGYRWNCVRVHQLMLIVG